MRRLIIAFHRHGRHNYTPMTFLYYYDNPAVSERYTAIANNGDVFTFTQTDGSTEPMLNLLDAHMTDRHGYGWSRNVSLSSKQSRKIIDDVLVKQKYISDLGTKIRFHALPATAKNIVKEFKLIEI